MLLSLWRVAVAVLLALPGLGLALLAKPLLLGEQALVLGIVLAFALPAGWLIAAGALRAGGGPGEGTDGR